MRIVKDDKWGFMDTKCNVIVEPKYAFADDYSKGIARVRITSYNVCYTKLLRMSENQICRPFIASEYKSKFKEKVKSNNDELNDLDLLKELGQTKVNNTDATANNKTIDSEINNLINGTTQKEPTADGMESYNFV